MLKELFELDKPTIISIITYVIIIEFTQEMTMNLSEFALHFHFVSLCLHEALSKVEQFIEVPDRILTPMDSRLHYSWDLFLPFLFPSSLPFLPSHLSFPFAIIMISFSLQDNYFYFLCHTAMLTSGFPYTRCQRRKCQNQRKNCSSNEMEGHRLYLTISFCIDMHAFVRLLLLVTAMLFEVLKSHMILGKIRGPPDNIYWIELIVLLGWGVTLATSREAGLHSPWGGEAAHLACKIRKN